MGDRVAVIKQGRLQQVDDPAGPVRRPGQPVRRRFHRFTGDEHGRGRPAPRGRRAGACRSPASRSRWTPETVVAIAPALARSKGGRSSWASAPRTSRTPAIHDDAGPDRVLRTRVDLREALGSEVLVHFTVDAPPVLTEDTRELARDAGVGGARGRASRGTVARSSRGSARAPRRGARRTCSSSVDTSRMHFFDPETGSRHLRRDRVTRARKEERHGDAQTPTSRGLIALTGAVLLGVGVQRRRRPRRRRRDTSPTPSSAVDLSGETVEVAATWTGAEQDRFEMVLDGVRRTDRRDRALPFGGRRHRRLRRAAHRGWRPARRRDPAAARRRADLREAGRPGRDRGRGRRRGRRELRRDRARGRLGRRHLVRRLVQDRPEVDGLVQRRPSSKAPAWNRPRPGTSCRPLAQTISDYGVAPYSIGADVGWPLSDLFENIYLRTAGPDMYDQLAQHEIPWTDQSVKDALTVMGEMLSDERSARRWHDRRRADRLQRLRHPGVRRPARGRDDLRGRLRRRRHHR